MRLNNNGLLIGVCGILILFALLALQEIAHIALFDDALLLVLVAMAGLYYAAWCFECGGRLQVVKRSFLRIKIKLFALSTFFILFLLAVKLLGFISEAHQVFSSSYLIWVVFAFVFFVIYFVYCDRYEILQNDEWFSLGVALRGKQYTKIVFFTPGIALKAFFIPLMVVWLDLAISQLRGAEVFHFNFSIAIIPDFIALGVTFDLFIGLSGYLFTSRLLGAEMSVDRGWRSWLFCFACYPPFYQLTNSIFKPSDSVYWQEYFEGHEVLYLIWGGVLASLWFVYWWATLSYGVRFSNLSYRGVVSSGPYKLMRHPAYFSKVCYWWLLTVPFVSPEGAFGVVQNLFCLVGVSWVYYMRAKEEDRFLIEFPEYLQYKAMVDSSGLRARINRLVV